MQRQQKKCNLHPKNIIAGAGNLYIQRGSEIASFRALSVEGTQALRPGHTFSAPGAGQFQTRLASLMGDFLAALGTDALSTGAGAAPAALSVSARSLP